VVTANIIFFLILIDTHFLILIMIPRLGQSIKLEASSYHAKTFFAVKRNWTHNLYINWRKVRLASLLHSVRRISVFLECSALAVFLMFTLQFRIHSLRNAATCH